MRKFEYSHTDYGRHGTMICCRCNKPICKGEYRIEDKPDRFILWHRECSTEDKEWPKLDAKRKEQAEQFAAYKQACREFVAKWGKPDEGDFDD